MKVSLAEGSGFCFGVERAMDLAYKYAGARKGKKLYSFHEIIHNPQEAARLEKAGAKHVDSVGAVGKGSSVIVSTHGITQKEEELLRKKCGSMLDTTCPYVKKIHHIVKKLSAEDYQVVIVGDAEHLEVIGIIGHAGNNGVVVSSLADVRELTMREKVGVVSQTTQNTQVYSEIIGAITGKAFLNRYAEVRSFNTICDATKNRQKATLELAKKSDVMIIVGGKNSANTRRLFEISAEILGDVYHVESAKELKNKWFTGKKNAGVSAGASTPGSVINEVVMKIRKIGEHK
jgi:4-hydroxy-3-methylbut-2-enyl diphosphate reductase